MHRRLQRISKTFHILGKNDVPEVSSFCLSCPCSSSCLLPFGVLNEQVQKAHRFIQQEYTRACLIAYESRPKDGFQEGWGRPGTNYQGVRLRTALLDTVRDIGAFFAR